MWAHLDLVQNVDDKKNPNTVMKNDVGHLRPKTKRDDFLELFPKVDNATCLEDSGSRTATKEGSTVTGKPFVFLLCALWTFLAKSSTK